MDGISLDAISVTLRFDLCSIMLNDLAEAIRRWTGKKKMDLCICWNLRFQ